VPEYSIYPRYVRSIVSRPKTCPSSANTRDVGSQHTTQARFICPSSFLCLPAYKQKTKYLYTITTQTKH